MIAIRVKCIKNEAWTNLTDVEIAHGIRGPSFGEILTVRTVAIGSDGHRYLRFYELQNPPYEYSHGTDEAEFLERWFVPVDARKTDISALTKILDDVRPKAPIKVE